MRIVAVADTHLFHGELVVPEGDVFVHAGDLCRGGSIVELELAARWILGLPHRHKVVIAGNHDWVFAESPAEACAVFGDGVHYLQDSGAEIEGLRFWGSPWQPEYNDWAFNLPRGAALAAKWAMIPEGIDVLVTHGPPEGIGDRSSYEGRNGCADLLARVRVVRPKLHLFGHIHEDGSVVEEDGVTFANVTTWECERGATVIDVDARGVTAVVVPPHGRRP